MLTGEFIRACVGYYSAADSGAEYCDDRVCLSVLFVSVRDHIFGTTRPIFTKLFVHYYYYYY